MSHRFVEEKKSFKAFEYLIFKKNPRNYETDYEKMDDQFISSVFYRDVIL